MRHRVSKSSYKPSEVANLASLDYQGESLLELSYNELGIDSEPVEHRQKLLADVQQKGILQPVIVVKKHKGKVLLVDGHHRALLALELSLCLPAYVIACECKEDASLRESILFRGNEERLCDFVIEFRQNQFKLTEDLG